MRLSILTLFFLSLIPYIGISQNCDIVMKVDKGRDIRSITPDDGTTFRLKIINKGDRPQTFDIRAIENLGSCRDDSIQLSENALITRVVSKDNLQNNIFVPADREVHFLVTVSMGKNTRLNEWYCIEVIANATECNDYITERLGVFVSDGKEH